MNVVGDYYCTSKYKDLQTLSIFACIKSGVTAHCPRLSTRPRRPLHTARSFLTARPLDFAILFHVCDHTPATTQYPRSFDSRPYCGRLPVGNPTSLVNPPTIYGQLTTDSIIPPSGARGFERKRTLNSAAAGVLRQGGWTYHTLLQEGATRAVEVKPFLTGGVSVKTSAISSNILHTTTEPRYGYFASAPLIPHSPRARLSFVRRQIQDPGPRYQHSLRTHSYREIH